jgi:glycosyltransferase involved in cell wall biosynthesis
VAVYMIAFNAEKTVCNAIDSFLAQSYQNKVLYICDNGSTDGTYEILKSYSDKYESVRLSQRSENFSGSFILCLYSVYNNMKLNFIWSQNSTIDFLPEYICFVDSDDTLHPQYIEKMVSYLDQNNLNMVMCGWDFVRTDHIDHRVAKQDTIIERARFGELLPYYDKFMGPIWNKMFRFSTFVKDISYFENKFSRLFKDGVYFYGADTAINYIWLSTVEKFGIISEILYNYNIHEDSVSRKGFHPMRIVADRRMAEVRLDFLQEINAEITEELKEFIFNIYFKSIRSTMDLLLNDTRFDLKQRMQYLHEIFSYDLWKEIFPSKAHRYL